MMPLYTPIGHAACRKPKAYNNQALLLDGMLPCLPACNSSPSRLHAFSGLFSTFVVIHSSSAGRRPCSYFHFRLGFGMDSQGKPFLSSVEAIAQVLYLSSICHHGFLLVHL